MGGNVGNEPEFFILGGSLLFLRWPVAKGEMQAFVLEPVDPLENDVIHVGFGFQRPGTER